jgi:membrane protease YdiL (CAAX protease family)
LTPVLLTLYWLDVQVFDSARHWNTAKILVKVSSAFGLALLIALAEETLFRGLLLVTLRRHLPLIGALLISSAYYAALHFLKSHSQIPYAQQTISSGFILMQEAFANWLNPKIGSAWLALFTVGLFLAQIRTRLPVSLGLCIGCHAGWVWQIKLCKDFFNLDTHAEYAYLVSAYDGVIGSLVSVWLGGAIVVWWLAARFDYSAQTRSL